MYNHPHIKISKTVETSARDVYIGISKVASLASKRGFRVFLIEGVLKLRLASDTTTKLRGQRYCVRRCARFGSERDSEGVMKRVSKGSACCFERRDYKRTDRWCHPCLAPLGPYILILVREG